MGPLHTDLGWHVSIIWLVLLVGLKLAGDLFWDLSMKKKKDEMDSTNRGEKDRKRRCSFVLQDTDPRKIWSSSVTERLSTPKRNTESRHCGVIVSDGCYIVPTL